MKITEGKWSIGQGGDIVKMGHVEKNYKPINLTIFQNIHNNPDHAREFFKDLKMAIENKDKTDG